MNSFLIMFGASVILMFSLIMACHFLPCKDRDDR